MAADFAHGAGRRDFSGWMVSLGQPLVNRRRSAAATAPVGGVSLG